MIISRTPFRVSFVGGGTDIKDYYSLDYGAVISTTINKYMYITVNKGFDKTIRVSYSKTELVDSVDKIEHPIVKAALKMLDIDGGIEITSIADIPAKAGLSSSSAFTVGLLKALYAYKGVYANNETIARQACEIEIDILKEPIGKQDQYAVAYGGMNYIRFNKDESVIVEPIICSNETKKIFQDNLMLFYTGVTRKTGDILKEQKKNSVNKKDYLDKMRNMTSDFKRFISNENSIDDIGKLLDLGWQMKKNMSSKISNNGIDEIYRKAIENGAIGGKILGAGGGGFLLLYCKKEKQQILKKALESDLMYIPFNFENTGSRIIFVE